jgi:hypothetical protein
MRAHEFVSESKEGKVSKRASHATPGIHKVRDAGGYDRTYHLNRLGMAMASADGKDKKPVQMDSASWVEKFNTVHPYTEAEHNMLHQAMNTVPTEHQEVVPFSKSMELDSTNKSSPIASRPKDFRKKK